MYIYVCTFHCTSIRSELQRASNSNGDANSNTIRFQVVRYVFSRIYLIVYMYAFNCFCGGHI